MSTEIIEWSSHRRRRLAVELRARRWYAVEVPNKTAKLVDVDGDGNAGSGTLGEDDEGNTGGHRAHERPGVEPAPPPRRPARERPVLRRHETGCTHIEMSRVESTPADQ